MQYTYKIRRIYLQMFLLVCYSNLSFLVAILQVSSDAHLFFCAGQFELQVGCLLLAVFQFLPRQLPLFFETTLHLAQLPLRLQQFGVQLGGAQRDG